MSASAPEEFKGTDGGWVEVEAHPTGAVRLEAFGDDFAIVYFDRDTAAALGWALLEAAGIDAHA